MERCGYQMLLLAGGLPGAGTTTAATNVAATASAAGKRVLVIDANFRRPHLASALGGQDEPGLGDVLAGMATCDMVIHEDEEGVSVMGPGRAANRVVERLSNGVFDEMLADLRSRFDLVVFDAAPAVVAGDALVLASKVDAAVLVVRAHQEQRGLVARLVHQLTDARCDLLGVVLNRARGTSGGYFKKNYATMAKYAARPAS